MKTPNFKPNTTITGKTKAQVASRNATEISPKDFRGGTCTTSCRANHHQVTHKEAPNMMPGTMPAMNNLEIDTFPATPKITKPMLGGMTGAMMPAEAIKPAERARSCPAATIMGKSKEASAAASATAEPDKAAMMTAAMMVT